MRMKQDETDMMQSKNWEMDTWRRIKPIERVCSLIDLPWFVFTFGCLPCERRCAGGKEE